MTASTLPASSLTVGDFVFLYLAQAGSFNTSNTRDYGSPLDANIQAGRFQINRVTDRSGIRVDLECDLDPAFRGRAPNSNGFHEMVLAKIVTGNTVTIQTDMGLLAPKFNSKAGSGSQNTGGGVVSIITNKLIMEAGSYISADFAGFSGGFPQKDNSRTSQYCDVGGSATSDYVCNSPADGGQKGASIMPFSEDPSVQRYCRGSSANGGGGGNFHNAAGGGGANVCDNWLSKPWTGDGVSFSVKIKFARS